MTVSIYAIYGTCIHVHVCTPAFRAMPVNLATKPKTHAAKVLIVIQRLQAAGPKQCGHLHQACRQPQTVNKPSLLLYNFICRAGIAHEPSSTAFCIATEEHAARAATFRMAVIRPTLQPSKVQKRGSLSTKP